MTKDEKEKYSRVARLGCIICRIVYGIKDTPAEIHHIRRYGAVRSESPIVPLCPTHHRHGNTSFHGLGAKGFEKHFGITCEELVERVEDLLNEQEL